MSIEATAVAYQKKSQQQEVELEALREELKAHREFIDSSRGGELLRQMSSAYEERDEYKYNDAMKELHDHIGCSAFPPYVTTNKE